MNLDEAHEYELIDRQYCQEFWTSSFTTTDEEDLENLLKCSTAVIVHMQETCDIIVDSDSQKVGQLFSVNNHFEPTFFVCPHCQDVCEIPL